MKDMLGPLRAKVKSQLSQLQFIKTGEQENTSNFPILKYSNGPDIQDYPIGTICHDTSERFLLRNDTISFYSTDPVQTADGNLLLAGEYYSFKAPNPNSGFLMKLGYDGSVKWFQSYDSLNRSNSHFIFYNKVLELQDGSILLAGSTDNKVTGHYDLIFTKTDKNGNVIWNKIFQSRLWSATKGAGTFAAYYLQQIKQDPTTGNIFVSGAGPDSTLYGPISIVCLAPSNGSIIWSKCYQSTLSSDLPFGIEVRQNELRMFFKGNAYYSSVIGMLRINKTTGDTLQTKFFKMDDPEAVYLQFSSWDPLKVLNDGSYAITGQCLGANLYNWDGITPLHQATLAKFDSNFNFIKAYSFKNRISNNVTNTRITVYPDGSGLYTTQNYVYQPAHYSDHYFVQFRNDQIVKQRKKRYGQEGVPFQPDAIRLPDGGDLMIRQLNSVYTDTAYVEFYKIHVNDTASSCLGYDVDSTFLHPFTCSPTYFNSRPIVSDIFQESPNKTILSTNGSLYKLPACYQVSYCDSLKLIAPSSAICLSQSLQLTARKNVGCGSSVYWQYDTSAISSVVKNNDTTLTFRFKSKWNGFIYGRILGCNTITDSIYISVSSAPVPLNLGPDTALCPNNTVQLNAHAGYASYLWQDGSKDSVFNVTKPGQYFVQVKDACGGFYSDTLLVSAQIPTPISAGLDRTKCNDDTIHFSVPSGFVSYQWSPNYNLSQPNLPSVVANPLVDTAYIIRAEKPMGCFSYDTVQVSVLHSPSINLGNDTSICIGQSLMLDAGVGFSNYQWNTGSNKSQITVGTAGSYSVIATATNGCKSLDTLKVLNINPLPTIGLNKTIGLCENEQRILDAGIFKSYQWQDGSTTRMFAETGLGKYYVTVTDQFGCVGSDTASITIIYPTPQDFLPADFAICSYETIVLKPFNNYANYLWSSVQRTSSISITQPGIYWLQVKDYNGCTGKDSINIVQKQCGTGLYVPTGFTPNGDGKNDVLRALLYGNIKSFNFSIYNRFGQKVFETKDNLSGWDGMINGQLQATGSYVWVCKYQLAEGKETTERGTTLLIRR